MPKNRRAQMTEDDLRILGYLQKNSYRTINAIAKGCGFSQQKVCRSIKKMEKDHLIWGYSTVTDDQKQDLQKFILLIKRSVKKIDSGTADQLISYRTDKDIANLGVIVENSYFSHGEYDWILIFTARDIRQAKKFANALVYKHQGMVANANLIQILMTMRSQNILNPEYMNMREYL